MESTRFSWLRLAMTAGALAGLASAEEKPVLHDHAAHTGAGLKLELIAGITEADFLKLGDQPKVMKITLVSAFTGTNHGMNFNGYSHGGATYTVPAGWRVEVTFINPSPVPHSAIVVERDTLRKIRMGEPAFKGASTPNPVTGLSSSQAAFAFIAGDPGEYALACGIPNHATGGHWLKLEVSSKAKAPTLQLGDAPPREAR